MGTVTVTTARVASNRSVADGYYVLEIEAPDVAGRAEAGQFVMIRPPGDRYDPLLPRAFSMAARSRDTLTFVYKVVGRMTTILSHLRPGEGLAVWGPLGRGFPLSGGRRYLLLGGGTGIAPLLDVATELSARNARYVLVCGGRSGSDLAFVERFEAGRDCLFYTEDGSLGTRGLVTEFLERTPLDGETVVFACGPTPMLRGVSALAMERGVRCLVSVETPMACGLGTCLGCTLPRREGEGYVRTCTEGPVFDVTEVRV